MVSQVSVAYSETGWDSLFSSLYLIMSAREIAEADTANCSVDKAASSGLMPGAKVMLLRGQQAPATNVGVWVHVSQETSIFET